MLKKVLADFLRSLIFTPITLLKKANKMDKVINNMAKNGEKWWEVVNF
jgi:hypothetical protein